jgi:hypothetical protein
VIPSHALFVSFQIFLIGSASLVLFRSRNHFIEVVPRKLGLVRPVSDFCCLIVLVEPDCERVVGVFCNYIALIAVGLLLPGSVLFRSRIVLVVLFVSFVART